jgi:hypothetical protein
MMKARFTVVLGLTAGLAGLVLSACSGGVTSTSGESGSSSPISREAKGEAITNYYSEFAVENQLKDWWGGNGIPITWKVSETDDSDWVGKTTRPDQAPPNGLQGLVQEPFSGVYKVKIELLGIFAYQRFVLTPAVTIDGQVVDLQPIVVKPKKNVASTGTVCEVPGPSAIVSLSAKTSRGLLMYDVVLTCASMGDQQVLIRNYQRS